MAGVVEPGNPFLLPWEPGGEPPERLIAPGSYSFEEAKAGAGTGPAIDPHWIAKDHRYLCGVDLAFGGGQIHRGNSAWLPLGGEIIMSCAEHDPFVGLDACAWGPAIIARLCIGNMIVAHDVRRLRYPGVIRPGLAVQVLYRVPSP